MNYLNKIETYYPSLTKSEKKIADYILLERGEVAYESAQEITSKVGVGEATLNRFCKKIGYTGFQELKLAIAKDDTAQDDEIQNDTYLEQVEENYRNTITRTKDVLDMSELDNAIKEINETNKIMIFGVGASGLAATECETSLLRVGVQARAITDPHFQTMQSSILTSDDLIIAFSLSGATEDLYKSLKIARKNNVKIITVTNYLLSPIAQLSNIVLLTAKKESLLDGGSLMAKVSQLYVIDLLCTGYSLLNESKVLDVKEKIARSLIHKSLE